MKEHPEHRLADEQYLNGLLGRDAAVLENIYQHFFPGIAKHVLDNSGSREDAEDVFQEGLLVLYRKAKGGNLTISSSFYTFFYAVCKRIWLKKLTRGKANRALPLEEERVGEIADDAAQALEQSEQYQLYRSKFKLLGEDCQNLLRLFFKGASIAEIAGQMGYGSEGYAKKRKFQCKEQLVQLIRADASYRELRRF